MRSPFSNGLRISTGHDRCAFQTVGLLLEHFLVVFCQSTAGVWNIFSITSGPRPLSEFESRRERANVRRGDRPERGVGLTLLEHFWHPVLNRGARA